MSTDALREVGRVGRAHGVQGDVAVQLITDRTERVAPGARLLVGAHWMTVAASRLVGERWLVRFEGIEDRTAAERLTNAVVKAEPLADDGDELWVHHLIGSRVVDVDGVDHGVCVAVIDNPAHEILELESGALVPVTFVLGCTSGITTIDPPDGLFDL